MGITTCIYGLTLSAQSRDIIEILVRRMFRAMAFEDRLLIERMNPDPDRCTPYNNHAQT